MKLKLFLITILQFVYAGFICSQESLIINVTNRSTVSLNGKWNYIVDPYENGYYNYRYQPFENFENPGKGAYFTNAKPENKSDLVEYDLINRIKLMCRAIGILKRKIYSIMKEAFGKKIIRLQKTKFIHRVLVYFGAVNYQADVYLNGKKLGRHIGGFTPFNSKSLLC
jgi:beta-glucuronidase